MKKKTQPKVTVATDRIHDVSAQLLDWSDTMTIGSLFSGIGGFELGLEWAGMGPVLWQVEIDTFARKVLEKHWPDTKRYGDIRDVGKHNLEAVDLICGGFPCQPFSVAGKRKGKEDDRYLWPEMVRVIEELRPSWVIGENVPGIKKMVESKTLVGVESGHAMRTENSDSYDSILSYEESMLFNNVLEDLEGIGYRTLPLCIPAVSVDAQHLRDRVWIVAHYDGGRLSKSNICTKQSRRTETVCSSKVVQHPIGKRCEKRDNAIIANRRGFTHRGCDEGVTADTECVNDDCAGHGTGEICGKRRKKTEIQRRFMADTGTHSMAQHWESGKDQRNGAGELQTNDSRKLWLPEPDVGRVVTRFSGELDGGLNAHDECYKKAITKGIPQTERLRTLRKYIDSTKASSESKRCAFCGHPLSSLSCKGACSPWYLGQRIEEKENLRCMREGIQQIYSQQGKDLQPFMSFCYREDKCEQTMENRTNRLECLGNAVVPQVVQAIGEIIMQWEREMNGKTND